MIGERRSLPSEIALTTPFEKRRHRQITAYNVSTIRDSENQSINQSRASASQLTGVWCQTFVDSFLFDGLGLLGQKRCCSCVCVVVRDGKLRHESVVNVWLLTKLYNSSWNNRIKPGSFYFSFVVFYLLLAQLTELFIIISRSNAICVPVCICLGVNQGSTNRKRCSQRLVILHAQTC